MTFWNLLNGVSNGLACNEKKKKQTTQTAVTGMTQMYVISYSIELNSFKE